MHPDPNIPIIQNHSDFVTAAWARITESTRNRVFVGLKFLTPFLLTAMVIFWIYGMMSDGLTSVGFDENDPLFPVIVIAIMFAVPFVIGIAVMIPLGRLIFRILEAFLISTPLVGSVFGVSKDISDALDPSAKTGFNRVVLVEYPRDGAWSIGFLTSVVKNEANEELGVVYIPTAPLPSSGFLALIPIDEIKDVDLNPTDAMRLILSSGVVAPGTIMAKTA